MPGVTIDRYGDVCLVQTWGDAFSKEDFAAFEYPGTPVYVPRGSDRPWGGPEVKHLFEELGLRYRFETPPPGKDPVLFLDLRCARRWLLANARGKVLNAFAYTCGTGLAAAKAGAQVLNVDHGRWCLDEGRYHGELNVLKMEFLREDFFCAVRQFAGLGVRNKQGMRRYRKHEFDQVILDPPTLAKGPYGSVDILRDYASLAKPALMVLKPGGQLLATHHHASVAYEDWVAGVRRCADKAGRPIASVERIRVEADFPSFDDNPPLKVAVFTLGAEFTS